VFCLYTFSTPCIYFSFFFSLLLSISTTFFVFVFATVLKTTTVCDNNMVSDSDPSPSEQVSQVADMWQGVVQADQQWCVVERKWFQAWCAFVGFDPQGGDPASCVLAERDESCFPGPLDNKDLADESFPQSLKKGINEMDHYALVTKSVYDLFESWYGGGPRFERSVMVLGLRREARVDFYPAFLRVIVVTDDSEPDETQASVKSISQRASLSDFINMMQTELGDEKELAKFAKDKERFVRVWIKKLQKDTSDADADANADADADADTTHSKWMLVRDGFEHQIETFQLPPGQVVVIEKRTVDGWPRSPVKKNFRDFEVGDHVDALDTSNKWYESEVVEVKKDQRKVMIHFINWPSRWDEWMDFDSDRIDMQGTHTDGPYQARISGRSGRSGGYSMMGYGGNDSGQPAQSGAVGLRNLGNTCFMNSTIQCLSNTPVLTEFFVDNHYAKDVNRRNPLGWKGRVAEEYAQLLKSLWSGKYRVVAPSGLKHILGQVAPRFSGYQQHDSSELLSFLLDGLHEDLNRIEDKPPTNGVDSKGRDDAIVAAEAWQVHKKRNDSIIVDLLQGQLKSKVVCPEEQCGRVSITFDPFMFLSVPLPSVAETSISVTFVYRDFVNKGGIVVEPVVSKVARISDLKKALSKMLDVPAKCMVVTELWREKITRLFSDDEGVTDIGARDDILVYEVPELATMMSPSKACIAQVFNTELVNKTTYTFKDDFPIIVAFEHDAELTAADVRKQLAEAAKGRTAASFDESKLDLSMMIATDYYSTQFRPLPADDQAPVNVMPKSRYSSSSYVSYSHKPHTRMCLRWPNEAYDNTHCKKRMRHESVGRPLNRSKNVLNVGHCINAFTKEEILGQDDAWYCSDCKEFRQASKKFDLWKLPEILVIHLKRFNYTRHNRDKIGDYVEFPMEGLDLSDHVVNPDEKGSAIYDLYAVSNHMGGLGGGHYTGKCVCCCCCCLPSLLCSLFLFLPENMHRAWMDTFIVCIRLLLSCLETGSDRVTSTMFPCAGRIIVDFKSTLVLVNPPHRGLQYLAHSLLCLFLCLCLIDIVLCMPQLFIYLFA
jgi:ubiquitin C-terminal hydrolase